MRPLTWLLLVASLTGCSATLTELVVVVDTDFAVPGELDQIDLVVVEPDATEELISTSLDATAPPITLGVVHRAGPAGPVRIEAIGRRGGVMRVHREIITEFVTGSSRLVRLDLLARCEADTCGAGQTCAAEGCIAIAVPGTALPTFTSVERIDAAPFDATGFDASEPDAGADAPFLDGGDDASCTFVSATEVCDGRDQDCDGTIDEGACACDPPCALDHASAICTAARTCAISACETGYANCDTQHETGCERSVRTLTDCGACDRPCTSTAGSTTCADGTCRIETCTNPRFRDCNGELVDGCEVNTDNSALHCGACGSPCPSPMRCRSGACS